MFKMGRRGGTCAYSFPPPSPLASDHRTEGASSLAANQLPVEQKRILPTKEEWEWGSPSPSLSLVGEREREEEEEEAI